MGDRANCRIIYGHSESNPKEPASIYFYTHWRGSHLPHLVQNALKKHWRWDDESYLARIIFCEMVRGEELGETGFGIAPYICDNEHPIIEVDIPKQVVRFEGGSNYSSKKVHQEWSFEEYCTMSEDKLEKAFA